MAEKDDVAGALGPRKLGDSERKLNVQAEWGKIGLVLADFNNIEAELATVIRLYIGPRNDRTEWVEKRLLNNLIIGFAAKLKLVLAISRDVGGPKLNQDKFQRLLTTRNALAHGHMQSAVRTNRNVLLAGLDPSKPYGAYLVLESIKGNGEVHEVLRDDAISEYFKNSEQVRKHLNDLINLLTPQEP